MNSDSVGNYNIIMFHGSMLFEIIFVGGSFISTGKKAMPFSAEAVL
jgi:hypothetical protein